MDNSKAATQAALWELWSRLLESLLTYFRDTPPAEVSAAYILAARAFLKDNGIVLEAMALRDVREQLAQLRGLAVPFFGQTDKEPKQ